MYKNTALSLATTSFQKQPDITIKLTVSIMNCYGICLPFLFLLFENLLGESPPGNRTDLSRCKLSHLGLEYTGNIGKTESNVRCQSWTSNQPHKVSGDYTDQMFPFGSKKASKNYCRNPDRKPTGPWCYTMNSDLIDETCAIPLCSISECRLTGPGMEYGGKHDKGTSGRHCFKWDKDRKKVLENGNYTRINKFPANNFPENSLSKAKKFCRNPNGDIGGPWCFVEQEELGYIEKEYCDIPFCYDPECSVFTKNYDTYMHFTDFNGSVFTDIKFSIKLWDSDNFNEASARLVLSVLALPLTGKEMADLGIGIELYISNKESALRYGNKDSPDYEPTPGILTSSNFTTFTLNWDRGFLTFGIEGQVKPIFLAEMKTKKNLLGFHKDKFYFYSVQGTNVIWNFPFCLDDDECDVHTTTGGEFQQFWPLRQKDIVQDLYIHIRAFRSAAILVTPSPTIDYPCFKIVFNGPNGNTRVTLKEFKTAKENVLKEIQLEGIIDYWQWSEFSISFFANSLQIYMKKAIGMHSLLESKEESFRKLRWFSVSSENSVAHWSFFCQPPYFAEPPMALLPECAINPNEPDYSGTQDVTSEGLPCLPWSGKKMIPDDMTTLFKNESAILDWKNFCRDPGSQGEGSWCYTKDPQVVQDVCSVRDCDRPEEMIVIVSTNQKGRKIFILPQWKEKGLHGGLKFALKEWNPDLLAGLVFVFFPKEGSGELALIIGAEMNEKVVLLLNGELIESKTFPHLISAGKWTDFWLQIRKGEIMFGFKGVPTPLFEWFDKEDKAFDPVFMTYHSHYETMPIGVFLQIDECHTENTTDNNFLKYFPIGLYSEQEHNTYTNLSLKMRGSGQIWLSLMWVANNLNSIQLKLDTINGVISLNIVKVAPKSTEPKLTPLIEKQVPDVMTNNSWTTYYLTWSETMMDIKKNNVSVISERMPGPVLVYWFSVAAASGWVTWSANCEPLDLDGPPIDGGWSEWSPWTCTVTCGGGEGFRTRTCSNPHPNIFGKLCEGHHTASGVCNDFPCGDISPDTLELIREKLKMKAYSYIVDEDHHIVIKNDKDLLKRVKKESPEAYYEWTKNGVFINTNERVLFEGDNIIIRKAKPADAGTYVSMIFRINKHRVVLKVITLSVRALKFNVDTRATYDYNLQCHAVILGYVYSDLSLKITLNNATYIDYGLTTLAAVNTYAFDSLNQSHSGIWQCVVQQKDLKLKWITNYINMRVKKKPNIYTHLMEDKLTGWFFGKLGSEGAVLAAVIVITIIVILGVAAFLFVYFKFFFLESRYKRNRRL
ncbi:uncharacterized protein LOC126736018 isoform X2 [Anthonomus grandis grandis]|uniref:uncharacterized protein LOC126736018 isoform X2 n=1 Tax=Anthonomus grandis grandis TaxID=2921223 RepID=UPI0021660C50|nr:uncharacterized protein LOC126736018 isoform X2 [Anthonomus grandis grandis]